MKLASLWSFLSGVVLASVLAVALPAGAAAPQQTFATPEAAVDALAAALKADTDAPLTAIFGEQYKDRLLDPDPAAAKGTRAQIVSAMQTLSVLKEPSGDRRILVIGDQAWPVPFPIVKTGDRWRFATEEGIEELMNRRIGGNERNAIASLRAFVDAQRAYAARDRDGQPGPSATARALPRGERGAWGRAPGSWRRLAWCGTTTSWPPQNGRAPDFEGWPLL